MTRKRTLSAGTLLIAPVVLTGLLALSPQAAEARPHHRSGVTFQVTIAPPALRTEVVPVRPGRNVVWVPGYWDWRPAAHDYVWVSGHWTRPPQRRAVWVAPRWERYGRHHRYVTGFWRY